LPTTQPAINARPTKRARRTAAKRKTLSRSRPRSMAIVVQLRKEIERPGDEHRSVRPGQLAGPREGVAGVGNGFNSGKVERRKRGELLGRKRARALRAGGNEDVRDGRQ